MEFRTKGQLAAGIAADALAEGICFDFLTGDEVYGSCTELRQFFEGRGQAYVLRVPRNFRLALPGGKTLTCAHAASQLDTGRRAEVRSAGKGSKSERWYAWSWLAMASPRHCLLIRRHLKTGELAFHYCFVPEGQPLTLTPADPRGRAALARGRRLRVRQGLLRPRRIPGPPLHRDRPAHCAGHGRPGHLRRHGRPSERPHQHLRATTGQARSAATCRPGHDPADSPRDRAPARRPGLPAQPTGPYRLLVPLETPAPSPLTLVPPAHTPRPEH